MLIENECRIPLTYSDLVLGDQHRLIAHFEDIRRLGVLLSRYTERKDASQSASRGALQPAQQTNVRSRYSLHDQLPETKNHLFDTANIAAFAKGYPRLSAKQHGDLFARSIEVNYKKRGMPFTPVFYEQLTNMVRS